MGVPTCLALTTIHLEHEIAGATVDLIDSCKCLCCSLSVRLHCMYSEAFRWCLRMHACGVKLCAAAARADETACAVGNRYWLGHGIAV